MVLPGSSSPSANLQWTSKLLFFFSHKLLPAGGFSRIQLALFSMKTRGMQCPTKSYSLLPAAPNKCHCQVSKDRSPSKRNAIHICCCPVHRQEHQTYNLNDNASAITFIITAFSTVKRWFEVNFPFPWRPYSSSNLNHTSTRCWVCRGPLTCSC